MAGDLEDLLVGVGHGTHEGLVAFTWGAPEGPPDATWITVFQDGRIQLRGQSEPTEDDTEHAGRGPIAAQDLAAAFLAHGLKDMDPEPPSDPSEGYTLAVSGGDVSWERHFTRETLEASPALQDMAHLFESLRAPFLSPPDRDPSAIAPLTVQTSTVFKGTMLVGGLLTCGLVGVMLWVVSRNMPKTLDGLGLRLRNRRRYAWKDLTLRKRVASHDPAVVMGYDLLTQDGRGIRLAAGAFEDGETVVQYVLDRMAEV